MPKGYTIVLGYIFALVLTGAAGAACIILARQYNLPTLVVDILPMCSAVFIFIIAAWFMVGCHDYKCKKRGHLYSAAEESEVGLASGLTGIMAAMVIMFTVLVVHHTAHFRWYGEGHANCVATSGIVVARGTTDGREAREDEERFLIVDVREEAREGVPKRYARHFFLMSDPNLNYPKEDTKITRISHCLPSWFDNEGNAMLVQIHEEGVPASAFIEL